MFLPQHRATESAPMAHPCNPPAVIPRNVAPAVVGRIVTAPPRELQQRIPRPGPTAHASRRPTATSVAPTTPGVKTGSAPGAFQQGTSPPGVTAQAKIPTLIEARSTCSIVALMPGWPDPQQSAPDPTGSAQVKTTPLETSSSWTGPVRTKRGNRTV